MAAYEEYAPMLFATEDDDVDVQYMLDLGSGSATQSGSATPFGIPGSPIVPPPPYALTTIPDLRRRTPRRNQDTERECGICFELPTAPVRTQCCSHIFCAEHILAWLEGPSSDGCCPTCHAPSSLTDLLALEYPAQLSLHLVSPPPENTAALSTGAKQPTYASYPSIPVPSSPSSPASTSSASSLSPSSSSEDDEDEDTTDYSLPELVHARSLQTRRHVSHPIASVLGLRGVCVSLMRALVCLLVIAVLAGRGRGRWADEIQGEGEVQLSQDGLECGVVLGEAL
ncbi:hypothetical protein FB45DRAFT_59884 [Roridomyces roridus]|uniref:RING-type domain-containing protein n=1 Tax=Roridomyces roridus TaxID=1738132 RepID=A0AAD7FJ94_9AGAR|nr:hypothetical protein FB45DRAFT_59884 [Roridomyces roridus]